MNIIHNIWKNARIACFSDMSDYYSQSLQKKNRNFFCYSKFDCPSIKFHELLECDYVVMAGMFASESYLESPGKKMVDRLVENGAKLIILGLGSERYTTRERSVLSKYYENIRPELIVTRDEKTYDAYKNCADILPGLDCAFWVKNTFDPRGFFKKKYNVHAFNRSIEPSELALEKIDVVRPWHMQWRVKLNNLKENYLISDTPFDYLTVYANANRVYTDLVHATIASLQYGTPVRYYYVDERSNAFDSVKSLVKNDDEFMHVDEIALEQQKLAIEEEIAKKIRCYE